MSALVGVLSLKPKQKAFRTNFQLSVTNFYSVALERFYLFVQQGQAKWSNDNSTLLLEHRSHFNMFLHSTAADADATFLVHFRSACSTSKKEH